MKPEPVVAQPDGAEQLVTVYNSVDHKTLGYSSRSAEDQTLVLISDELVSLSRLRSVLYESK